MARLIDAGELLEQIDKYMAMTLYGCTFRGGKIPPMMLEMRQAVLCDVKQLIYSAPTIDAAPVRRGEWHVCKDVDGNEYGKCSCCGGETYDGDNDTFDQPPDFCEHCGADMRGAGNER